MDYPHWMVRAMYAGPTYGKEDVTVLTSQGGSREFTQINGTSGSVSCLMRLTRAVWRKKDLVGKRGFPGRSRPGFFPFICRGGSALICTDGLERMCVGNCGPVGVCLRRGVCAGSPTHYVWDSMLRPLRESPLVRNWFS